MSLIILRTPGEATEDVHRSNYRSFVQSVMAISVNSARAGFTCRKSIDIASTPASTRWISLITHHAGMLTRAAHFFPCRDKTMQGSSPVGARTRFPMVFSYLLAGDVMSEIFHTIPICRRAADRRLESRYASMQCLNVSLTQFTKPL